MNIKKRMGLKFLFYCTTQMSDQCRLPGAGFFK
uniref:Uncharacterized protein n=1 Tax=Anguilla anguilla TaxID=7936 RepID=A0A0E9W7L3_ANGAN